MYGSVQLSLELFYTKEIEWGGLKLFDFTLLFQIYASIRNPLSTISLDIHADASQCKQNLWQNGLHELTIQKISRCMNLQLRYPDATWV
jgi:hypothetical protein